MTHRLKAWALGATGLGAALLGLPGFGTARADPYPTMAPASAYLMPDRDAEIALARSAAPPSVAADADVMVLDAKGYVTAAHGKNGFVCVVSRAWFSRLDDPGFWNPKLRGPICFNPEAARSVLAPYLVRTRWAMAGVSRAEIKQRVRAAMASGKFPAPEVGSFTFMLSKGGYLGDIPHGPWHPHLMWYMPASVKAADWGANLPGSRVMGDDAGPDPYTMFYVPMPKWSDGTPDEDMGAHHDM